jgi:hypothetical protein
MTKLQIRAFLYQLGCFMIFISAARYLVEHYTELTGYWFCHCVFSLGQVSPKFQVIKPRWKLFMKWVLPRGEGNRIVCWLQYKKGANYKSFIISLFYIDSKPTFCWGFLKDNSCYFFYIGDEIRNRIIKPYPKSPS